MSNNAILKMFCFLSLWVGIQNLNANVSSTTGTLDFKPQSTTTVMTLNSTGLGIGMTPSTNLSVAGNAIISQTLSVGGASLGSNLSLHGTFDFPHKW